MEPSTGLSEGDRNGKTNKQGQKEGDDGNTKFGPWMIATKKGKFKQVKEINKVGNQRGEESGSKATGSRFGILSNFNTDDMGKMTQNIRQSIKVPNMIHSFQEGESSKSKHQKVRDHQPNRVQMESRKNEKLDNQPMQSHAKNNKKHISSPIIGSRTTQKAESEKLDRTKHSVVIINNNEAAGIPRHAHPDHTTLERDGGNMEKRSNRVKGRPPEQNVDTTDNFMHEDGNNVQNSKESSDEDYHMESENDEEASTSDSDDFITDEDAMEAERHVHESGI